MSLSSYIRVEAENLEGVQTALLLHGHRAQWALRRAINKTLKWAQSHGTRAIAQEQGVPLKVLRSRKRIAIHPATNNDLSGLAWFGLAPIKAGYLGVLRQTSSGAKAGSRFFAGAFVATMQTGASSAFRKLGESVPSGLNDPTHTGIFKREGKSRFPIKEQYVSISASQNALRRIAGQVPGRMRTVFRQEMNYAVNVQRAA